MIKLIIICFLFEWSSYLLIFFFVYKYNDSQDYVGRAAIFYFSVIIPHSLGKYGAPSRTNKTYDDQLGHQQRNIMGNLGLQITKIIVRLTIQIKKLIGILTIQIKNK